jgi:hypothetical protein
MQGDYQEPKKFSDFAGHGGESFQGEKIKTGDIVDKEITVKGFKTVPDKFSADPSALVTLIHFEMDGTDYVTFTRSAVLIQQLQLHKDKLPFITKIIRPEGKRYLTFS